uniref:NR LBD domain-containing protein n=1 Tax=Gongylonema pulchrum TaxID=637853 RepID=A0A183DZ59_9BILA
LDELLSPLRRISIEKAEISALKALVLLHPDVMGLTITSREKLRDARDGVLRALFAYLRQMLSPADASVRLSNLLLVIPSVYSIAQNLAQSSQLGVLFAPDIYDSYAIADQNVHDMKFTWMSTYRDRKTGYWESAVRILGKISVQPFYSQNKPVIIANGSEVTP